MTREFHVKSWSLLFPDETMTLTVEPVEFDRCTTHDKPIGEVTRMNGVLLNGAYFTRPFVWHLDGDGFPMTYCLPPEERGEG